MRNLIALCILINAQLCYPQSRMSDLPVLSKDVTTRPKYDWLLNAVEEKAEIYRTADSKKIIIDNGLIQRSFLVEPDFTCISYIIKSNDQQLLRSLSPEAIITVDGREYTIGGSKGPMEQAYFKYSWIKDLTSNSNTFKYKSFTIQPLSTYINWKYNSREWAGNKNLASGKTLTISFSCNQPSAQDIGVDVHYEIYDGIPLVCKWISVSNYSSKSVKLNKIINEVLRVPEEESSVAGKVNELMPPHGIYIESNYAFNNSMTARHSDQTTHWLADTTYKSQVNYDLQTPCLLEVYPSIGPGVVLERGENFQSIRTYELLLDSYDRERNGLAQRMMYHKIVPWATENPIFLHLTSTEPEIVKNAIDQCAETGYEAVILSFGSGLNMEDTTAANVSRIKALVDYGHKNGIMVGGYSLFSSRQINDQEDVIDPKSGKPDVHAAYGHAPCLASNWGLNYIKKLKYFISHTGLDVFENDGAYPGDVCASTKHPGHKGLEDSQWVQMELQKELYHWCNEKGVYLNVPDWYFLDGANKVALGYREVNFSLPREQQIILNRQNIYDGTWEKMPSMSWGFVPLTEYHGGGADATLEPLSQHLDAYQQLMFQYYGSGIQACYRGPRLYDTERTKNVVKETITWYKRYRTILNSQIIHLRRPDGRDWDGIMHINPNLKEKGFVLLYNPLDVEITRTVKLPLYFTGLRDRASIREKEGKALSVNIDRDYCVDYKIKIAPKGYTWLVIE
jgi:hypothetical protein